MKILTASKSDLTEFKIKDINIQVIKDGFEFDHTISYVLDMSIIDYKNYVINNFGVSIGRVETVNGYTIGYLYTEEEGIAEKWRDWVNGMLLIKVMVGYAKRIT